MTIDQIVASSGNGQLKDNSECSHELRTFLAQVESARLAEYATHCLENAFPKSGLVLQDIVNELGRRLGYQVTNGLYQGTSKSPGNDGLWSIKGTRDILVEVKTTDVYRIPLDKIAFYRDELLTQGKISKNNSMLIVVGREDTGELEAQVRGSRHAWDMRLISVESLVRLVSLMEQTESGETSGMIQSLLTPIEYTRLDRLVDVMFTTAREVVETIQDEQSESVSDPTGSRGDRSGHMKELDGKRAQVISAFGQKNNYKLIKKTNVLYWNDTHDFRIACAVSKHYDRGMPYWYAYHPAWDNFLSESRSTFFVLGCMDQNYAFAIPHAVLKERLEEMDTSTKPNGTRYWHIRAFVNDGTYYLHMSKSGKHLPIEDYRFQLS